MILDLTVDEVTAIHFSLLHATTSLETEPFKSLEHTNKNQEILKDIDSALAKVSKISIATSKQK